MLITCLPLIGCLGFCCEQFGVRLGFGFPNYVISKSLHRAIGPVFCSWWPLWGKPPRLDRIGDNILHGVFRSSTLRCTHSHPPRAERVIHFWDVRRILKRHLCAPVSSSNAEVRVRVPSIRKAKVEQTRHSAEQ